METTVSEDQANLRTLFAHFIKALSLRQLRIYYVTLFVFGFTAIAMQDIMSVVMTLLAGDSVFAFSYFQGFTILGAGIGFLATYFLLNNEMYERYIQAELGLSQINALSLPIAFSIFALTPSEFAIPFILLLYFATSVFVGVEDAVLVRGAGRYEESLRTTISFCFFFSHLGGAIAGFLFAPVLLRYIELVRLAQILAFMDSVVVLWNIIAFKDNLMHVNVKIGIILATMVLIVTLFANAKEVRMYIEQQNYPHPIQSLKSNSYGTKVMTRDELGNYHLYIDGQLQFSTLDSHVYHEMLIHPAIAAADARFDEPLRVMIAGGGDGLAAAELLKYSPDVIAEVLVVDIDPQITSDLALSEPLVSINTGSMKDPRVQVVNADVYSYMRSIQPGHYHVFIMDLIDPDKPDVARLYSAEFFAWVFGTSNSELPNGMLVHEGVFVTQSTSPFYAPKTFWAINLTMEHIVGEGNVIAYKDTIHSFRGDWGFNMASRMPIDSASLKIDETKTRYLTNELWFASLVFSKESKQTREELKSRGDAIVSTTLNPVVYQFYIYEWGAYDED